MPVNPFQATAEMSWGGYQSMKQAQGAVGGRLGGGLEKGYTSSANMQGPTKGELKPTPQAKGAMPMGKADIGRPDYGRGAPEAPAREGRRTAFGGMGAGATKGGGSGMTAGGDISFDLSIGKTQTGDIKGSVGSLGMGATTKDSMVGSKIDQSQKYAPTFAGGKAGSSRGGDGGAGKGGTSGAGRGGAGGNAARGGDVGDSMADFSGVKFGNPTAQVGRNKFTGRDDMSDNRKTTTVKTTTDARKMPPAKEGPASKKPDPKKPATEPAKPGAKPAEKPVGKSPASKPAEKPAEKPAGKSPTPSKPAEEKPAKKTKAATKAKVKETEERSAIKDKAKSDLESATKKTPPPPANKGKVTKKKTAGKVTKEEEE